jgi:hypothetical protein
MILKWEKELEHPDHTLIQHQNFARLLKTKEDIQPKRKSVKTIGFKKQTNFTLNLPRIRIIFEHTETRKETS